MKIWLLRSATFIATLLICTFLRENLNLSAGEILLVSLLILTIFIFHNLAKLQKPVRDKSIDNTYPYTIILGVVVSLYENFTAFQELMS